MGKMVQSLESFAITIKGRKEVVAQGEILDADHDIVKRTPAAWWKPLKARFAVEQATAAPGESRAARVRVKKDADDADK